MFEPFFYLLRGQGLPVTPTEWLSLQQAVGGDLSRSSLGSFYALSRALLVKSERHYDLFDRVFAHYFAGAETSEDILETILAGMKDVDARQLSAEELSRLGVLSLDELRKRFQKKYEEGRYDEHVGGSEQIGTGGRSPTGDLGDNPGGLRIGEREAGRLGKAVQVATKRRFKDLSGERVLDTRQIQAALSRLKALLPEGPEDQLHLEKTIDRTARGGGEIDLVFEAERRNKVKVALFLDAGGSMLPYAKTVDLLFSAARGLFRQVDHFYFHNCLYQQIWRSFSSNERLDTDKVLRELDPRAKAIFVGDAAMALTELLARDGSIDYFLRNDLPGIGWLEKAARALPRAVWLNPLPERRWGMSDSTSYIRRIFPMYELTLDGLDQAGRYLMTGRR